jgi:hypothetical protein
VLAGGLDISVNGKRLSNGLAGSTTGGGPANPPNPTPYFPTTGKPGNTFFVPQEFFNANGKAVVGIGSGPAVTVDVEDNYHQPLDYYYNLQGDAAEAVVTVVPRPIVKPSRPENILVRLVNLSSDAVAGSSSDETLSLAYANGNAVSAVTSRVAKGKWSEYIELPYGTYEFKVMIDGSARQYPALPPYPMSIQGGDDLTVMDTRLYFTQKRVFQPGGVYTIVTAYDQGKYEDNQTTIKAKVNAFTIITDLSPSANLSYARIQVANAMAETGLQIRIDNNDRADISYGHAGDYTIVTKGTHTVYLQDAAGGFIREEKITVKGGDNFTLWVHPGKDNKGAITTVQNNMSGIINLAENSDGSDGSTAVFDPLTTSAMPLQTRFLNFCTDLPYATFTGKNGATLLPGTTIYPVAAVNIPYGTPPDPGLVPYPYINLAAVWIETYQSQPASVPGNRLYETSPLTSGDFINMPGSLYPNGLPEGEPGVYTVALIGRNNATQKPKLVVIKHNK